MTTPKALYRTPVDLVNTPKAFANPSPGLERSDNPGIEYKKTIKPRRGSSLMRTLSGFTRLFLINPRVVAALQPWAGVSERLRRNHPKFNRA